jgi:hypothetical protein
LLAVATCPGQLTRRVFNVQDCTFRWGWVGDGDARLAAKSTGSGRWHVCRRRFRPRQRPARQGACDACIAHLHTARQRRPQNLASSLAGREGPVEKILPRLLHQVRTKSPDGVPGGGCVAVSRMRRSNWLAGMICWWRELQSAGSHLLSALV